MATIRCPMCGKNNPAEAEACVYCQARLHPLEETPAEPLVSKPKRPASGGTAWLRRIGLGDEPSSEEPSETEAEESTTPTPDEVTPSEENLPAGSGGTAWLRRIGLGSEPSTKEPSETESEESATTTPDEETPSEENLPAGSGGTAWLRRIGLGGEPSSEEPSETEAEESVTTTPEEATPAEENPPVEEPADETISEAEEAVLPKATAYTADSFPAEEAPEDQAVSAPANMPTESPGKEAPEEEPEQPAAEEETREENKPEAPPEEPAAQEAGVRQPSLPDWLLTLAGIPRPESEALPPTPEAIANEEIKEALQSLAEEETLEWEGAGIPEEESAEVPNLAPAELPAWLEALRPPPADVPAETVEEGSGPLAGLTGILPAEGIAPSYRKPVEASLDFQISEKQRLQAILFEQMLSGESRPAASAAPRSSWLRLAVALLLIGLVLAALWMGGLPLSNLQPVAPAAVGDFYQQLEAVPQGATVLLAAEYDPGFAAEMHFAAQAALERLMQKQANLVSISTLPAGPVLAQQLLQTAHDDLLIRDPAASAYDLAKQTASLGYLPGGITSLQEFARRPQQVTGYVPAWSSNAPSAWESPALARITQVSDFSLVIVLTDKIENGQGWIEQVAPVLNGAPLLLISSAQAAPLLQPYLASGQVQGMLAGLADGQALAQLQGAGNASAHWSAYQYGLLLAVILALVGALFQIFRRKPQSGEQT